MIKSTLFILIFITGLSVFAQNTNLSDYSFVVVPVQFSFLSEPDQFELNSMAKFYLEKNGFNAYFSNDVPNIERCDGLYFNVNIISSVFGTKMEIVLNDCHNNQIYQGPEGKSKYKDHLKAYQDALRKSFQGLEALKVNQEQPVIMDDKIAKTSKESPKTNITDTSGPPTAKFSNFFFDGKSYLLRKTEEGYSLYRESNASNDGLLLTGKITSEGTGFKFTDTSGKIGNAYFDRSGNLHIQEGESRSFYQLKP